MDATTAQPADRTGALRIRPVTAADAPAMADFLAGLDSAARRLRFHGGVHPQSPALLRHLTSADGLQHAAWVAVVHTGAGAQVVGEARYVRCGHGSAELAMSVAAGWCGRGLADQLLATLTRHAGQAGVGQLVAEVLGENGRMQAFLQRHGYADAQGADLFADSQRGAVLRLVRDVHAQPRRPAAWRGWPGAAAAAAGAAGAALRGLVALAGLAAWASRRRVTRA